MKSPSSCHKNARPPFGAKCVAYLLAALVLALASQRGTAQNAVEPVTGGTRGLSFTSTASGDRDSSSGWSSILDTSARYDFSRVFGVELGVPYYMSHTGFDSSKVVGIRRNPPLVVSYNSLGDVYLILHLKAPQTWFNYRANLTGTAPSGDTSSGISTGRSTFDLNNHFDHTWGLLTPLVEAGVGDSSALVDKGPRLLKIRSPYTTLGPLSHYKAGSMFDFLKVFTFEASAYEELPIGDQKVYARVTRLATLKSGRQVQRTRLVATGQGILEDNGLNGGLIIDLGTHVALTGVYQRSLRQSLDTVAFGVSYTLGKRTNRSILQ